MSGAVRTVASVLPPTSASILLSMLCKSGKAGASRPSHHWQKGLPLHAAGRGNCSCSSQALDPRNPEATGIGIYWRWKYSDLKYENTSSFVSFYYFDLRHPFLFFFGCTIYLFFFYWSIVDLQCCINFHCIAKWFNYTDIYILFLYSFPLWFIIGYWI